tara:strand:+ start:1363 stop:1788 length:426 start_codon:yes stop_codon:yes gene_type:complete
MSIILKKKKGLLIPKSHQPSPGQALYGLGIGSIIGASLGKKEEIVDSLIEEAIENFIMEKLLLRSSRLIRSLDYFVTFYLSGGEKSIKSIYIKKRMWFDYVKLEEQEMLATGAKPEEFLHFLKKKRCKNIKICREQLEKII